MPPQSRRNVLALTAVVVFTSLVMLAAFLWAVWVDTIAVAAVRKDAIPGGGQAGQGFAWLRPVIVGAPDAARHGPDGVTVADYTFSKTVMLQSVFDANDGDCTTSVKALTVNYGDAVVYCYIYTNIGSTRFITVSMTDDKLGALGPVPFTHPLQPGGQNGFVAFGVIVTQTIINTANAVLIDEFGTEVARSDSAIVSPGTPTTPSATATATETPTVTATATHTPTVTHTPTATATQPPAHRVWLPMMIRGEAVTERQPGAANPTF